MTVDRRTRHYLSALTLIELLLNGESISLDDADQRRTVEVSGFAIDMNMIWQRLLGRVLTEWSEGFRIQEESRGNRLLGYLDAKYRDLWTKSLTREMLYQLAVYAVAQGGGVVTILLRVALVSRALRPTRFGLQTNDQTSSANPPTALPSRHEEMQRRPSGTRRP